MPLFNPSPKGGEGGCVFADLGFQVHTTGQLKEKHLFAWSGDMLARGRSKRTAINNMTHIRKRSIIAVPLSGGQAR
ncbi:hypothetical protein BCO19218_07133 [Burkholderia contaminans]|nr:hypothetical protein BCO19218_07133 [Burkholderia contaminans]